MNDFQENRKVLTELFVNKSALKQDIVQETQVIFNLLKEVITEELEHFQSTIEDKRVRLVSKENGKTELQAFVGSDCLLFHMHSNVFLLPRQHPLWQTTECMKEDPSNGYFGIIYIYNFLAESILKERMGDPGYLLARIFVNKSGQFFVEGKAEITNGYKGLSDVSINKEKLQLIVQNAFAYAITFDLLTPPFELVSQINVQQAIAIANSASLQTGKRLGFKFEKDD